MENESKKKTKYKCVLLVDDNDIDNFINERMIISHYFAKKVITKKNGADALSFLTNECKSPENTPEIIFLDLNMPIMNGFEFLKEYDKLIGKKSFLEKHCKILVLSSSISPGDVEKASRNPYVYKYLNKPLNDHYLNAINY